MRSSFQSRRALTHFSKYSETRAMKSRAGRIWRSEEMDRNASSGFAPLAGVIRRRISGNGLPANWNLIRKRRGAPGERAGDPAARILMQIYSQNAPVTHAAESVMPVVVAFVSPKSKGTMDTVNKARKKGFKVFIIPYGGVDE